MDDKSPVGGSSPQPQPRERHVSIELAAIPESGSSFHQQQQSYPPPLPSSAVPSAAPSTPSYAASQFSTLIHRQQRRQPGILKLPPVTQKPSSRLRVENFAGWGETEYMEEVGKEEESALEEEEKEEKTKMGEGVLGSWRATGVVGPAVAGSPFYAFPAVVDVASVYSPISLLIATLLLPLFYPILTSLASTLPISGATYNYTLLLSRTRTLSLLAASLTILDDVATSVVSAATGSAYVMGQFASTGGVKDWMICLVVLVAVGALGLVGLRAGAGVGMTLLVFHLLVMTTLFISSVVFWGRNGSATLITNWHSSEAGSARAIATAIWKGVCISFLGVTGYETSPDFLSSLKPRTFPKVLRNLQILAILLNSPIMLMAFVVLPIEDIGGNPSILNSVAERTVGKVLSILVTIDAMGILSAGVLTGSISACAIFGRLADDGVLPKQLLKTMPVTHAPLYSIILFTALCLVVYGSSGASLSIMSSMFALVFLSIMALYPLCSLLLSYHLPRLSSPSSSRKANTLSPYYVTLVLLLSLALIIGNVILSPISLAYFAAYTGAIGIFLSLIAVRSGMLSIVGRWLEDKWSSGEKWSKDVGRLWREEPRVIFVESDEISRLMEMILFIRRNENTNRIKLVHCYRDIESIPKELEANHRILDEAFPSITIDLIFIQSAFTPALAHVLSKRLKIPRAQCFMGCPSAEFPYGIEEFRGVRIIAV